MTNAYWSQFSKQEIDSMHGIEPEDQEDDTDLDQDEDHTNMEQDGCSCSNGCMDCLGMTWRDFY